MTRILQVTKFYPPSFGGMERVVQVYAEGLAKRGHAVEVLCFADAEAPANQPDRADRTPVSDARREPRNGTIDIRRFSASARIVNIPWSRSFIQDVHAAAKRFDIVHVHEPFPTGTVAALRLPRSTPLVVTWHGDVVRGGLLRLANDSLQAKLCAKADAILVASQKLCDGSRILPRFKDRVHVVPLGLDLARFAPNAVSATAVEDIRKRVGRPFALAVGRLVGYKGFEVLIDAVAARNIPTVIIGTGPLEASLRRRAADRGVSDLVIFQGAVTDADLPAWYRAAEFLAFPSITSAEAFGLVQVEAMASGLPVINTDLPTGVPEVSVHGETGLTVPVGSATDLAEAMATLMGDRDLRDRLAQAAVVRAEARYSNDAVVDRLCDTYDRVLVTKAPAVTVAG